MMTRQAPDSWTAVRQDVAQGVDQLEAAERQGEHGVDATAGIAGERMLRHGEDDDGNIQAGVAQTSR